MKRLLHGLSELGSAPDISITDVIYPGDERERHPACYKAIAK